MTARLNWGLSILVLVASAGYFVMLATPDLTWVSVDHDLADTLWSTRVFGLQHPTGAPLYTALGWLVTRGVVEWGQVAHRLAVSLSAIPAAITAMILYAKTRRIEAPLLFCASGLIVSQASLPKYYPLVGLIVLLQWLTKDKPWFWLVSLAGVSIHHVPGFTLLILTVWRWRHGLSWWPLFALAPLTLGIYWSYWRFAVQPPSDVGWRGSTFQGYMGGQGFLFMGLSPFPFSPLLARLRDIGLILPASLGVGLLGLVWVKDRWLLVLIGLLTLHYATNLDPHTYTYLFAPLTLAVLAVCQSAPPLRFRQVAGAVAALMIVWDIGHYDIGRNLDQSPTVARSAYAQFKDLPDGSVLDVAELGASDFMPFLFSGRWEAVLSRNKAVQGTVTHCEYVLDYSTLRAVILPINDPRCSSMDQ